MVEHSQSEEANLNTTPVVPNGNGHVTENNNQRQETSLVVTPTNPINPAAASDGGSAAAPRSKFTLHQKITLLGAALTSFSTWSSYAVIAVFFPTVAEAKGMSQTVVGLVFSCHFIACGIGAPLWGKVLPHFGARFVFLAGAFVTGGCIILLGFVVDMPTLATFTGFTFAIRTLEGLGTSACNTAVGAILTYTFMDDVGVATSLMETVVGTSFALAPVIGGLFYNMGGFKVPFFVLGGFVWACVAGNYFVMPKIGNQHEEAGPMIQVMKLPAVWVVLLASSFTMLTYSAMDAVLAPHLKQLGFSVIGTSLLFGGWGVTYALTAVLCGYIVDKKKITRILMVLGAFASALGLLLTGPSPFLNIPQSTTLICIVFPATSCAIAMITVPTLPDILITTKWHGIPDSLGVNSVVSGLWFAASSFGSMMGPIISGTVTEYYGFAYTTTVLAGGFLAVMLLMCFFGVWEYQCGKGRRLPKHRLVVEATEEEKVTLLSKET